MGVLRERIVHVGISGQVHRNRRRLAVLKALDVIRRLDEDTALQGPEFAMEVHRALVLALSSRMACGTTPARAAGVLAAAAADVAPGWRSERQSARYEAEEVFAPRKVGC